MTPSNSTPLSEQNNAVSKQRKWLFLGSFIISLFLFLTGGSFLGISIWKHTTGSEFSQSYDVAFEINTNSEPSDYDPGGGTEYPFADNSTVFIPSRAWTEGNYDTIGASMAKQLSAYLNYHGYQDISTSYELREIAGEPKPHLFLHANMPQLFYFDEDDNKIPINKFSQFFTNFNSSRLTMIVNWQDTPTSDKNTFVLPLSTLIDTKNLTIDKSNKSTIDIHLFHGFSSSDSGDQISIIDTILNSKKSSDKQIANMIVVRDYDKLISYLSFIMQVYNDKGTSTLSAQEKTDIKKYLKFKQTGEEQFYTDYKNFIDTTGATEPNCFGLNSLNLTYHETSFTGADQEKISIKDSTPAIPSHDQECGVSHFNALPYFLSTTRDDSDKSKFDSGKRTYHFLDNFLLGYGVQDDPTTTSPSADSFLDLIPNISPIDTKTKKPSDSYSWDWLKLKLTNQSQAQELYNCMQNSMFDFPIRNNGAATDSAEASTEPKTYSTSKCLEENVKDYAPLLSDGFTTLNSLISMFVALCAIILAFAIIVAFFFRLPGAFGFCSSFFSLNLSVMIMVLNKFMLSFSMFVGAILGLIGSFISIAAICLTFKKIKREGLDVEVAVKRGIKRMFFSVLDIHFVMLIVAICITYFTPSQYSDSGTILLIYTLFSFVAIGGLWPLSIYLLSRWSWKKKEALFVSTKMKPIEPLPVSSSNYVSFYSNKFKFNTIKHHANWLKWLILGLIVAICVAGALMYYFGITNSFAASGGYRVVVGKECFEANPLIFEGYVSKFLSFDNYYLIYLPTFDIQSLKEHVDSSWGVSFQTLDTYGFNQDMTTTIKAMLIASGLLSAYVFIRMNWTSVVPIFIGSLLTPCVVALFSIIVQLPIDSYFPLLLIIIYFINAIIVVHFTYLINNQYIRSQYIDKHTLKSIIQAEIANSVPLFGVVGIFILAIAIIFFIFAPAGLWYMSIIILLSFVFAILNFVTVIPMILTLFIRLRYRYLNTVSNISNPLLKNNYDIVDEQLIVGVNSMTKTSPFSNKQKNKPKGEN